MFQLFIAIDAALFLLTIIINDYQSLTFYISFEIEDHLRVLGGGGVEGQNSS